MREEMKNCQQPTGVNASIRFLIAFLTLVCVTACSESRDNQLVVYSAGPRNLAEWMCGKFEDETGIETKLYSATTGEIMAKLEAESGRTPADVVLLASPTAAEALKDQQMLVSLPAGLPFRQEWTDPEGYYSGTSACAIGIALRKDGYDPNLEWDDFFEGRLPGRVMMPAPSQSGSSAEFAIAMDNALGEVFWDGLKAAKKRGLQVSGPNSQALTGLVLRSHDAVLASADYLVFKQIEKGEPLVVHFPQSGSPVVPRPVAILKTPRNAANAEKFVEFCFRKDVQTRIAEEHLIPADITVPLSSLRQSAVNVNPMPLNVQQAKNTQKAVLRRFQVEIEKGER